MLDIDKYLSVVWKMGGRTYPILDCYGIVHEVRHDLGLSEWPIFEGIIKDGGSIDIVAKEFKNNISQCDPSPGAVAACYEGGMISHLAVIVEIGGILHAMESNPKKNVTILPLQRFERRYMKVEYYQ